jgi:hypothetical protein
VSSFELKWSPPPCMQGRGETATATATGHDPTRTYVQPPTNQTVQQTDRQTDRQTNILRCSDDLSSGSGPGSSIFSLPTLFHSFSRGVSCRVVPCPALRPGVLVV